MAIYPPVFHTMANSLAIILTGSAFDLRIKTLYLSTNSRWQNFNFDVHIHHQTSAIGEVPQNQGAVLLYVLALTSFELNLHF